MTIGVISDTHDAIQKTMDVLTLLKYAGITTVIHCGDWKGVATADAIVRFCIDNELTLYGVLGNNDKDVKGFMDFAHRYESHNVAIVEGALTIPVPNRHVVAYHGHHAPTLRKQRADPSIDILLLGHTHKPKIEDESKLIINPGSLAFAIPRSKQWRPSYAIVDTETRSATIQYL